jgi:perosamine synthetase
MFLKRISMHDFIPISRPSITQLEIDYVHDAVTSSWVSSLGPYIDRFEADFARFAGCSHAVCVSNGTVAIHLALVVNGIGVGDEVIVPDLSFIATANAVLHAGATPVFVDVEPDTLCMDPGKLMSALTPRTKAIIPVHLYGHPADMGRICAFAQEHGLIVIEDAAEAHGASIEGRPVGSFGKCATFSFYGNKCLTTGEGGIITTNDPNLYAQCRHMRDHAMDPERRYWHTVPGYNYRMTNLQAALGCAQLERADYLLARRREIFEGYTTRLGHLEGISLNRTRPGYHNTFWLVCLELTKGTLRQRDDLMRRLKEHGVDSRPYFYPMSHMPYFQTADTPVSAYKSTVGINLPTYADLTESAIDRVCSALIQLL